MNPYKIEENIYARETNKYAISLFANKDFKKDELVFLAFGPIVNEVTLYTIPISRDLKIDPTKPEGNLSQYICHSCSPNLGIKNRTCFVAFKDIQKDDEMIGYEYGDEISEEGRVCKCGSAECRGKWSSYKELSQEIRFKYKGYISEYLLEMD